MEFSASTARLAVLVPLAVVTVDIIRRIVQTRTERKGYPLPPGPSPLPIVGNVLSVNTEEPWLTYTEWRAKYGDIIYIRLMDSDIVILNSPSVATDLLEQRSQIYSDRPFIATVEPYGHDCNFAFTRYGDHWRLCRRIFHQTFRAESALGFRPMQLRRARQMIVNMIDELDGYPSYFATFSAAVSMSAVYDYEPSPRNDPMVSIIENYLEASVPALTSEKALLLKTFPFLLNVPEWFPGSWIKREAKAAYEWRNKAVETPYQYVQKRMESGDYSNTAMVADHLTRMEKLDDSYRSVYELALKHASATAFLGSAETTTSTLMTFTLAMVENPHVWKRAQAEIDAVIGTGRLPEFDDRPHLPYIDAVVRETLRWRPVVPLGVPHSAIAQDTYNGYYIPEGAIIIANAWYVPLFPQESQHDDAPSSRAMSRDEARYPNAENFIPERFLDDEGMLTDDEPQYVFGFGRRVCPGRRTADASVWSSIATMLATLDFDLAKDKDGMDVTFTATFANGITQHPNPFPCQLVPRAHVSGEYLEHMLSQ